MAKVFFGNREVSYSIQDKYTVNRAIDNGMLVNSGQLIEFDDRVHTIGDYGLYYAYTNNATLTKTPDFRNINKINQYGCFEAFNNCTNLTEPVDLSSLTTIGYYG